MLGLGSAVAAAPSVVNVASRCRRPAMSAGLKSSFSRLQGLKFSDITSPLTAVILLSFVLAVGFLLIILSCALWANWLPLLVGVYRVSFNRYSLSSCLAFSLALIFVVAPLPNALFSHCGQDDFSADNEGSGPVDFGRFLTSMTVVTGFAFPVILAHSEIIRPAACIMSIIGGGYVSSHCYSILR